MKNELQYIKYIKELVLHSKFCDIKANLNYITTLNVVNTCVPCTGELKFKVRITLNPSVCTSETMSIKVRLVNQPTFLPLEIIFLPDNCVTDALMINLK